MQVCFDFPEGYSDTPFESINRTDLRYLRGVYIFYDSSKIPLYVGKTINLGNRIGGHASSSPFYFQSDFIRFYKVPELWLMDVLETYLINEINPEYNIEKTYYTEIVIEKMIKRIDGRLDFYKLREQALLELIEENDGLNYDQDDILSAEKTLENVQKELRSLNMRRNYVLRRTINENLTK